MGHTDVKQGAKSGANDIGGVKMFRVRKRGCLYKVQFKFWFLWLDVRGPLSLCTVLFDSEANSLDFIRRNT